MHQMNRHLRATMNRILGYPRIRAQRRKLPSDSMLVASFPKSGTTALRFTWWVLAHLLDDSEPPLSWKRMNEVLPQLPNWRTDRGLDFGSWNSSILPLLAATHDPVVEPFKGMRSILIIRDPVDCMSSWHRYRSANKRDRFEGDLRALIEDPRLGIQAWITHTKAWLSSASCSTRFEQLMNDPASTFEKILNAFDFQIPRETILEATAISMGDGVAKAEQDSEIEEKFDASFQFARKKESRDVARTTDPLTVNLIHDAVRQADLGYLLEDDQ